MNHIAFNYLLKKLNTNNDSLEELFNFYYSRIIIYISDKYEDGDKIAQDVSQEFFKYLVKTGYTQYIKYPTQWVYKCCDHIALKLLKTERKYCRINNNYSTREVTIDDDLYGDLDIYIRQLDETTQQIIKMIYGFGYSAKEISNILGIKYGTIRQKHSRAIKKIKNLHNTVTKSQNKRP